MGETTAIGWTDHTFNAWIGCTEAGPACDMCYARELDKRYQWGIPGPQAKANRAAGIAGHWGPGVPRYRTSVSNWNQPLKWNAAAESRGVPAKVFCNSLSDVFDNEVEQAWRNDLFDLWVKTPWLRWQPVTKRIGNAPKMLKDQLPKNVGLVITVCNQEELVRDYKKLFAVPAQWHGFSFEPQIDLIKLTMGLAGHKGSLWFITGGESRQKGVLDEHGKERQPRPYHHEWARSLILDAAKLRSYGHEWRVYVKQMGAANDLGINDDMAKDPAAWPVDIRVQEFVPELLH